MDESDEFEVITDLTWLRDNKSEADDLLEYLSRGGVSGPLAEFARHLRAVKGGSWKTGLFRLPCPAPDQFEMVRAALAEHERVSTSNNVRALLGAVRHDIQKCVRMAPR